MHRDGRQEMVEYDSSGICNHYCYTLSCFCSYEFRVVSCYWISSGTELEGRGVPCNENGLICMIDYMIDHSTIDHKPLI